jgi:hypothetical protein
MQLCWQVKRMAGLWNCSIVSGCQVAGHFSIRHRKIAIVSFVITLTRIAKHFYILFIIYAVERRVWRYSLICKHLSVVGCADNV